MSPLDRNAIIRAWRDPAHRARLSDAERARLPEHPCGRALTELDEAELHEVAGGRAVAPSTAEIGRSCCFVCLPPPEDA